MKKIRKGKKILLIALIAIVAVVIIVVAVKLINEAGKTPDVPVVDQYVPLPETTYSEMEVKNIVMELRKGNAQDGKDETVVTFEIHNTTNEKIESQFFEAVLIDDDENVIARMQHNYVKNLDVDEVQRINVVYKGDLTATTHIKLIKE